MIGRVQLLIIVVIIIVFLGSLSGCIFHSQEVKINIYYSAIYEDTLDLNELVLIFSQHDILLHDDFKEPVEYSLMFSFGQDINNDSIKTTDGMIWECSAKSESYSNDCVSELIISLNEESYPSVKKNDGYKKKLDSRKPLLEDSMDYITSLISNKTGSTPPSLEFLYGDTIESTY